MKVIFVKQNVTAWLLALSFLTVGAFSNIACSRSTEPAKEKTTEQINDKEQVTPNDGGDVQDDNKPNPDKTNPGGDPTIMDIQDAKSSKHPAKDATVILKGVIATTPVFNASKTMKGFFIADPSFPNKFGGVLVVVSSQFAETIAVGDELDVEGFYTEYYNNSQVNASSLKGGSVTKTGKNLSSKIKAIEVKPADVVGTPTDKANPEDSPAEAYEGMLVELKNVTVAETADKYGVWKLEGGVIVDDTFFKGHKPAKGDKIAFVRGVVYYSYDLYRILPRSFNDVDGAKAQCAKDEDCGTGRKCDTAKGECKQIECAADTDCKTGEVCKTETKRCEKPVQTMTIPKIQDASASGHPAKKDPVELKGVIVTSPIFKVSSNLNGFFVADPSFPKKFGGVMVVVGKDYTETLEIGDEIDLTGKYDEYYNNSQVSVNTSQGDKITKTGNNKKDKIKAIEVKASDIPGDPTDKNDPDKSPAEPYEGMLVELKDVTVDEAPDQYGVWKLAGGVVVDDTILKDVKPAKGDKIKSITGVLYYSYNVYRLLPRVASDVKK